MGIAKMIVLFGNWMLFLFGNSPNHLLLFCNSQSVPCLKMGDFFVVNEANESTQSTICHWNFARTGVQMSERIEYVQTSQKMQRSWDKDLTRHAHQHTHLPAVHLSDCPVAWNSLQMPWNALPSTLETLKALEEWSHWSSLKAQTS